MADDRIAAGTAPPEEKVRSYPPVNDNRGFCYTLIDKPLTIQDIKNNLVYFRVRAKYTQRAFAKAMGVSQALTSLWESPSDPSFFTEEQRPKVCKILDCEEKYIDRNGLAFIYDTRASTSRVSSNRLVTLHSPPLNVQELKQNLTYYRVQAGMSQKQLAEVIGVKQPVLAAWESVRDRRLFPDSMLPELVSALHCPESDLDRHGFDFAIDTDGNKMINVRSAAGNVLTLQLPVCNVFDAKNNLRYYRKLRGLTLQKLGARLGVVPATISTWENDKDERFIPTMRIQAVAKALDCPPEHLTVDLIASAHRAISAAEDRVQAPSVYTPLASEQHNPDGSWALEALGITTNHSESTIIANATDLRLVAYSRDLVLPVMGAQELPITWQEMAGIKSVPRQYACVRMLDDSMVNYSTGLGFAAGDYAIIDTDRRDLNECVGHVVCLALPANILVVARIKLQDGVKCLFYDNSTRNADMGRVIPPEATVVGRVINVLKKL